MRGTRNEVVEELNRLMAEEAEASLRYFHMRFRVRGRNRQVAQRFFDEALKETMEHAEAIARQIEALGHVPTLRVQLSLGGEPLRADEALADALEVEQQALDAYKEFLLRVAGHPVLEEFIRKQIDVETEHVHEIREVVHGRPALKLVSKSKG